MTNKIAAWTAVVAWMALIFILSHQPAAVSSGLSSGITEFLLGLLKGVFPDSNAGIDKLHTFVRKNAHFTAYFFLAVLLVNAFGKWRKLTGRALLVSFLVAVLYAASDEFHQLFIDGRSGELRDVAIDSAGAAVGVLLSWLLGQGARDRKQNLLGNCNE